MNLIDTSDDVSVDAHLIMNYEQGDLATRLKHLKERSRWWMVVCSQTPKQILFQLSVSVSISILSGFYSFSLYDVLQYTYTYTFHCILIFRIFLIFLNLRFHMIWIFPTPILIAGDLILKYHLNFKLYYWYVQLGKLQ